MRSLHYDAGHDCIWHLSCIRTPEPCCLLWCPPVHMGFIAPHACLLCMMRGMTASGIIISRSSPTILHTERGEAPLPPLSLHHLRPSFTGHTIAKDKQRQERGEWGLGRSLQSADNWDQRHNLLESDKLVLQFFI